MSQKHIQVLTALALLAAPFASANEYYYTGAECTLTGDLQDLRPNSKRDFPSKIVFRVDSTWLEGDDRAPLRTSHAVTNLPPELARIIEGVLRPRSVRHRFYEDLASPLYRGRDRLDSNHWVYLGSGRWGYDRSKGWEYDRYDLRLEELKGDGLVKVVELLNRGERSLSLEALLRERGAVRFGKILFGHRLFEESLLSNRLGVVEEVSRIQLHTDPRTSDGLSLHLMIGCKSTYDTRRYGFKSVPPISEVQSKSVEASAPEAIEAPSPAVAAD
jgi:hypothetical protein